MSLARYLSKLGALLNSDGKVPSGALASGAARANFGAGAVLQVVTATTSTQVTTTGSSYQDFLTASITPSSTSSKILVLAYVPFGVYQDVGSTRDEAQCYYQIQQNATQIVESYLQIGGAGWNQYAKRYLNNFSASILMSPNTTSGITYKIQHMADPSGTYATLKSSLNNKASTLTLLEIAA